MSHKAHDKLAKSLEFSIRCCPLLPVALAFALLPIFGVANCIAQENEYSPYEVTLREHGVEPSVEGLRRYLRQLHPDEARRTEALRLIEQLGNERLADRELAMKQLIALPLPPIQMLREFAQHPDPEIRWRAIKILKVQMPKRVLLLHAVIKTIELQKTTGLTAELLKAVSICDEPYLQLAMRNALRETPIAEDEQLLREAIGSDDPDIVIAAVGALAALVNTGAAADLKKLTMHESEAINLAAATALADQGDRASFAPLLKLLKSNKLEIRIGAVQTLRQFTGKQHNFVPYSDAAEREKSIAQWTEWVSGAGQTAKLHFPLKRVGFEYGRTLITDYGRNKVFELDASGKQVWSKTGFQHPWVAIGLPNGHRIVSDYNAKKVVEFNAAGEEVWSKEDLPASPFNVQRLENGNTLIACSDSQKVIEVDPKGDQVWELHIDGRPMDARRLANGHTLVTLQTGNRVVEVDKEGSVHWELNGASGPITSRRLANGNTLVAEVTGNRVSEWDLTGKLVWEQKELQNPYSAQRLDNGNTLIVHGLDVREVDHSGKIIWKKEMTETAHAMRY